MKISFEITKQKILKLIPLAVIFIAGTCIGIAMTEYKLSYSFKQATLKSTQQAKVLPTLAELKKYSPNTTIDNYTFSKIPNFVAIQSGQKVFYMSNNGQYVLIGALYDIKNRIGITSEELNNFNTNPIFKHKKAVEPHMKWGSCNKKGEIILNKGGKYKIAVFGDLHCPYCQRLETMLDKLTDVEIHYIPVVIHEDARELTLQVLASKNKQSALKEGFNTGHIHEKPINLDKYRSILKENTDKFMNSGVTGTPTIVKTDGTLLQGLPRTQAQLKTFITNK